MMKKALNLVAALMLVICTIGLSQTQMNNWYIGPKKIDMTVSAPVPAPITPVYGTAAAATTGHVANGFYDNSLNGDLLFYIADGNVYDYNNTLLGTIQSSGAEVIIIPFGDNNSCQRKFNLFSTYPGTISGLGLYKTVLDMNSFSLSSSDQIDWLPFNTQTGAIAAGTASSITLDRYLYFMAANGIPGTPDGQIKKLIVHNDGSVTSSGFLYPNLSAPNVNAGAEVFARELDLSPDGRWLAWASFHQTNIANRYHLVQLDPISGNYVNGTYRQFIIPGIADNHIGGFRGVEFWQGVGNKLFIGAGSNGIFFINLPLLNNPPLFSDFTPIIGSNPPNFSFGFSQIELANNGYMYASSGGAGNNIGAFDPASGAPQILAVNSITLSSPPPPTVLWQGTTLYTLPDQIDGQDYSLITPAAVPQVATTGTYIFGSTGTQTATWTYGGGANNPWSTSTPVQVITELRIKNNSNLTIDGMKFKFSPDAKVVIEQGSTLTLKSQSVFTSNYMDEPCIIPYTWIGVEVWGVKTASQNTLPLVQGKLTLKNNSKIEYAQWGARAWNGLSLSTAGGIIISNNSTFQNCNIDVEFKPYQNFYINSVGINVLVGNKSSFTNSGFINDNKYPFATAPRHAVLEGCTGIVFSGCTFNNTFALQLMLNWLSYGIKSLNANFTVTNGSAFNNIYHAIDAKRTLGTKGTRTFSVFSSTFTNNQTGIYTDNVNNFIVQLCTFNIGGNLKSGATTQLGISNQYGTGFTIEENNFNFSPNSTFSTVSRWGIGTYNTGSASNQIYKNNLTGIRIGNFAWGVNRSTTNPTLQGLQYLCNLNSSNTEYDFFINSNNSIAADGIRLFQGTSTSPARNTFSSVITGTPNHVNNSTGIALTYYWKAPNEPQSFNAPFVVPQVVASGSDQCPSNICTPPCAIPQLSAGEIQQLYNEFDASETAYLNMLYSYNELMDGGSTNALLLQIQQNWSTDVVTLYNQLMSRSPYLSQDILRDVANRNVLPQAMLLTVCMANADATRDEKFLRFLQYDIPAPLPHYMINLIISSWDNATVRTAMENMLAGYNHQMAVISNKILGDLYNKSAQDVDDVDPTDTTNIMQQINYWLLRIQTIEAKYDLIENYFGAEDYIAAEEALSSIPVDFRLSAEQQQAHNDYIFFYEFRKEIYDNGGDLSLLESSQIAMLINFTEGNDNFAKGLAQNVLCFYYDLCREDNYDLPSGNRLLHLTNAPGAIDLNESIHSENIVSVSPNPAKDVVTFNYHFPSVKTPPVVTICDITGKEIARFTLQNTQGNLILETGSINDGNYYYYIKNGSIIIARGKITIKK